MARRQQVGCPFSRSVHLCALYIAMHEPNLPSCWHRNLEDGCAVQQGKASYDDLMVELARRAPLLVVERAAAAGAEQRKRNMRLLGIR